MKVLICAGGTGGHIYPALAAVTGLKKRGLRSEDFLWLGTTGAMEEALVPREGLRLETLAGGAVVSSVPLSQRIMNVGKIGWSVGTASNHIRQFRPDVMFMTGGYAAASASVAAWLHRVPIGIYLPDVEPGSTIRFTTPLATKIGCTSEASQAYIPASKMVVTGYPVRPELRAATQMTQVEALAEFQLLPNRPTLFVFGGSRGAWNINEALLKALPRLLEQAQVIHITGTLTWDKVNEAAATLPGRLRAYYRPFAYLHEQMGAAFRAADLVLARSGASMLGECPAFGLPAVLVPLTFAWRYQKVNADYLTERGAAIQTTDEALAAGLYDIVMPLLQDEARLAQMRAAATALDKPDATDRLAQMILDLGGRG
ncbi:MAG: UDP-N-acetylglucosamine--N-acetylmuramyl-(pentapeptide) pyrophosphoryl-undecaprenol N-acetylglucosamine transferase [Anaerolineales bacterium]|nr:UDP-N-acetylglucosamine--N-acetylmuramyl-(pentapeptide) pyrophosphoryl-undecaprenol N-acetylglucosamine transferase [Anaerolineales bacterium]